jgi:hypothetical protein
MKSGEGGSASQQGQRSRTLLTTPAAARGPSPKCPSRPPCRMRATAHRPWGVHVVGIALVAGEGILRCNPAALAQ